MYSILVMVHEMAPISSILVAAFALFVVVMIVAEMFFDVKREIQLDNVGNEASALDDEPEEV